MTHHEDPFRPHAHEPNPLPPTSDTAITLIEPGGITIITLDDLRRLPRTVVRDCLIVSTGHGISGPFSFAGVTLKDVIASRTDNYWRELTILSADGFGTRLYAHEVFEPTDRPILLAYELDGRLLTREKGLVRLIVPSETDDALRQVKWVREIQLIV